MKNKLVYKFIILTFSLFILLIPESCTISTGSTLAGNENKGGVLNNIREKGKLVVLTDDNPLNFFLYNGELKGYQYEMLQRFADHLGVKLEIRVESNPHIALQSLRQRKVDLLAMEIPYTDVTKYSVNFSEPFFNSRQVLVQRKPENWRQMRNMQTVKEHMVTDLSQLKGQTLVLPAGKYKQFYLSDLQQATNNQVDLIGRNEVNITDLIEAVANKSADYTIAYEHTARAMANLYPDLDINTPVSPEMGVSWVVRKGAVNLLSELNQWIETNHDSRAFAYIHEKYYEYPRWAKLALGHSVKHYSISDYDEIIRKSSKSIDWDWRLVAALIYQESKFQPNARSHVGAFGLMQLMPATAKQFGASIESTPAEQIAAGIKLIKYLDNQFKTRVPDPVERKKFVLAAYNIGLAHINDAYNLAIKHNKNPEVWYDNVESCLLSKSEPEFYNDPVVKYGRVSGKETQRFVTNVMEKFDQYKATARG